MSFFSLPVAGSPRTLVVVIEDLCLDIEFLIFLNWGILRKCFWDVFFSIVFGELL